MKLWNQSLSVARARASQTEAAARETRDRGLPPLGKMKTDFFLAFWKISEDFCFFDSPLSFFSLSLSSLSPTKLSTSLPLSQHPALPLPARIQNSAAAARSHCREKKRKREKKKCKNFFFAKKSSTSFPLPPSSTSLPLFPFQELIRSCTPIASFSCS